jgi:formylglycine-generating enzyme required for sulfatase activity
MRYVPALEIQMGEGNEVHNVRIEAFYIAQYPVTNASYQKFLMDSGHPSPLNWPEGLYFELIGDHPVANITWQDACAYCRWLSAETGQDYHLPTEAQWEAAARGPAGLIYPWGNKFDKARCNTWEAGMGRTTPVDAYPEGASPYRVMDLVGNVWEWCNTLYADYPYRADDGRETPDAQGWRVLRGGSWLDFEWGARAARRLSGQPDYATRNTGFRVACEA